MKTFLMATQQRFFSKNLIEILETTYKGLHLQTVSNNGEMRSMLKSDKYDLAIVISDLDALTLSTGIISAGLAVPVLVYTQTSHIPFIKQLYGAGVSGVLNADDGDHEILKAVADILAKRIYMSENLKQELLRTTIIVDEYDEYSNETEEIEAIQNTFRFSHVSNNVGFTFIGQLIPIFTIYLN